MNEPEDVWTWLVGGTAVDAKMEICGYLCHCADLDLNDIDQIIREVIVDALFGGLAGKQILLGLVLRELPPTATYIHPHFLDAFEPSLKSDKHLNVRPLNLHPEPGRAIGSICQRLFEAVKEELGILCILATDRDAFMRRYVEP